MASYLNDRSDDGGIRVSFGLDHHISYPRTRNWVGERGCGIWIQYRLCLLEGPCRESVVAHESRNSCGILSNAGTSRYCMMINTRNVEILTKYCQGEIKTKPENGDREEGTWKY